jgi:DNA-binding IclR family transcriptional regulator
MSDYTYKQFDPGQFKRERALVLQHITESDGPIPFSELRLRTGFTQGRLIRHLQSLMRTHNVRSTGNSEWRIA